MPEARQIIFSHQEVAETLVKQQGLHEGLWGIFVEFGIAAANMSPAPGANATPTAIVPIMSMGLQRLNEEVHGLSVDAAIVNPAPKSPDESPAAKEG